MIRFRFMIPLQHLGGAEEARYAIMPGRIIPPSSIAFGCDYSMSLSFL